MKKAISLFVSVAMVLGLLAGCGTQQIPASSGSDSSQEESKASAEESTAEEESTGGEPTPISAFVNYVSGVEDLSTNYATKMIEEEFNVKFSWDGALRGPDCNEKFNILINSGSALPDVIMAHEAVDNTAKWQYGEQGLFLPLNDLIEKYGDNQKKLFQQVPDMKSQMTSPDGNIYSLGNYSEILHAQYNDDMWINKTWLDKLKLEMPETLEDLEKVLEAFVTQDPNGNGENDELGIVGNSEWWGGFWYGYLTNPFIYSGANPYTMEQGTMGSLVDRDEYKEALKYMNKLWNKGYIDNLSMTQNGDQVRQTVMGDAVQAGIIPAYSSSFLPSIVNRAWNM